ncbi:hypothetical protein [Arenibacterium halophilum]|uniref:Uncharacterized protein n=1 Tax=Arenibacterium halophilum TaxID=2583821 RepID=A0ABY2WXZ2_9RHOB|nr:hypothetical protein [Arenibacterium halophilum]TMV07319.1 hypothetical protein FGK64_21955 [Arenibacterium halophilum]
MRSYDTDTTDFLAEKVGIVAHQLVWITAVNTATSLEETLGVWTGEDDITLTIDGASRGYIGAGGLITIDPIVASKGLGVRMQQIYLSPAAPEMEDIVKGYRTRLAPIEIHRVLFRADTRERVGFSHRLFRGFINAVEFPISPSGGEASCIITAASETQALTRALPSKKSHQTFTANGGDDFRQYGDTSGSVPVYWGEKRFEPAATPPPQPPTSPEPWSPDVDWPTYPGA